MSTRSFLDALLDGLGVNERVTLVMHDWGAMLGFDWANRHRSALKGIAYMEATVRPRVFAEWDEQVRALFQALRSPAGEKMVLEQNFFVERMLPQMVLRPLTEEEMEQYRRPFAEPGEGRRPMLTIPRQVPIDGEPADVAEVVRGNLATEGLQILAVTMTNGNSRMKHVRARLPLVSQTVTFPRQLSNSS